MNKKKPSVSFGPRRFHRHRLSFKKVFAPLFSKSGYFLLQQQLELLLCATQFLTRIPIPPQPGFSADWINRSARYFPLVGQFVGLVAAMVLLLAAQFWSGFTAGLLALLTAVLLTGALHEDGLADTADGLGGGRDAAHRLAIMKDSRIGVYGVLALGFGTALKLVSLASLSPWTASWSLIAAHGVARAATVAVMHALPYAGDEASAKISTRVEPPSPNEVFIALAIGAWPLLFLNGMRSLLGLAICAGITLALALTARRLIGGQRGDILGAVEQLCEAGFLLGYAAHIGTI
ncbi:MAG TPA: adenosylcobinamide-GDP ribazoletransferase [Acidocella sp.]|uniref:adenosylcobinamide-GDP ribazoletransferase n=1 Tax=Acidocella sp. TaxID=50710 RepID=UPI002C13728B|nr:adenosylcobinamide-GDP ribazoletransferase [Acidocella sp.]HVE23282.1 adenosylcobinamide-GDP ribazoletransferase [Acidocella sp.]